MQTEGAPTESFSQLVAIIDLTEDAGEDADEAADDPSTKKRKRVSTKGGGRKVAKMEPCQDLVPAETGPTITSWVCRICGEADTKVNVALANLGPKGFPHTRKFFSEQSEERTFATAIQKHSVANDHYPEWNFTPTNGFFTKHHGDGVQLEPDILVWRLLLLASTNHDFADFTKWVNWPPVSLVELTAYVFYRLGQCQQYMNENFSKQKTNYKKALENRWAKEDGEKAGAKAGAKAEEPACFKSKCEEMLQGLYKAFAMGIQQNFHKMRDKDASYVWNTIQDVFYGGIGNLPLCWFCLGIGENILSCLGPAFQSGYVSLHLHGV